MNGSRFNNVKFVNKVRAYHRLFKKKAKKELKKRFFAELLEYKKVVDEISKAKRNGFDFRMPISEEILQIQNEEEAQIYLDSPAISKQLVKKHRQMTNALLAAWSLTSIFALALVAKAYQQGEITTPKTATDWTLAALAGACAIASWALFKVVGRYDTALHVLEEVRVDIAALSHIGDRRIKTD